MPFTSGPRRPVREHGHVDDLGGGHEGTICATPPPAVIATAYGALALGLLNAAQSAYWALGGTAGLDSVGGPIEEMVRARAPLTLAFIWVVVAVKLAAAVLGIATVRVRSGWWRRPLLAMTWAAALVLTLYGGVLVVAGVLVVTRVIAASPDADWAGLYGHLYLWDPRFLLWGLLLLATVTMSATGSRSSRSTSGTLPA